MYLSPCQEIFSHIPRIFVRPSAPLTPPFFPVCQVFFRISSSNFLSSFCQEKFCQVQVFSFLIFKNVKRFLRSKLYARLFRLCQEIFSFKQQQQAAALFKITPLLLSFVKKFFHKSSTKIFLPYPEKRRIIILWGEGKGNKNRHRELLRSKRKKFLPNPDAHAIIYT